MGCCRISRSVMRLTLALLAGTGAALFAPPVDAADLAAPVGPPTPLFSPSSPVAAPVSAPHPVHNVPVASPGRHPAAPVQRVPLDAKPLIPPAALPARLGPPPEPRPALSLETDLEPLGAAPPSGAPAAAPTKPPSS